MIQIEGKNYAIDMNKLMEFVTTPEKNDLSRDTTVVETYGMPQLMTSDGDLVADPSKFGLISKEISTSKGNESESSLPLRYDLVKNFLSTLVTPMAGSDGGPIIIESIDELTFGQKICFNTLMHAGILIEID